MPLNTIDPLVGPGGETSLSDLRAMHRDLERFAGVEVDIALLDSLIKRMGTGILMEAGALQAGREIRIRYDIV